MRKPPAIEDFVLTLASYYAWVKECRDDSSRHLAVAEKYPGQDYLSNHYRRVSDGKLFLHVDDGFVEALPGEKVVYYKTTGLLAAEQGRAFIHCPWGSWKGGINYLVAIEVQGTTHVLERAPGYCSNTPWAWAPAKRGEDALTYCQAGLKRAEKSVAAAEYLLLHFDLVKAILEVDKDVDFQGLCQRFSINRSEMLDPGSLSAFMTELQEYRRTGKQISVCY